MKLTLKQVFKSYPIKIIGVAKRLGKSREWLSWMMYNRASSKTPENVNMLKKIETEIHKIGEELQNIEIVSK